MNITLQLLSLQVSKHLRCFRLFLLSLLLCGFMQTMAQTWTDGNGLTWSFTINGTEATDIKFRGGPNTEWVYLYGDPNRSEEEKVENPQRPFVVGAWDAAAMRFSNTYGAHLPTIPDDVYFDLKTLIFDVSDVSEDFDMRVMNSSWSATYYDHVKWKDGLNDLQITEVMSNDCAGGHDRDLTLMLLSGSMTLNAVFYASSAESFAVEIPAKVYDGSTELTVTSIGNFAFSGFSGLTSVTIPNSVTSIGNYAFYGCTSLQLIKSFITEPYSINKDVFPYDVYRSATLYIPAGTEKLYTRFDGWKEFLKIEEMDELEQPEIPGADKCATPIISYENGKLSFSCQTKGVEYKYKIEANDAKEGYGNDIQMTKTYRVTVYAIKDGMNNSDPAIASILIAGGKDGDVNDDGVVDAADIVKVTNIIMGAE